MKNYKLVTLVIAIISVVSVFTLTGCFEKKNNEEKNNGVVVNSGDNNQENEISGEEIEDNVEITPEEIGADKYAELAQSLPEEIKSYADTIYTYQIFFEEVSEEITATQYGLSPLMTAKRGLENPLASLGYVSSDLDKDGTAELLIYDMNATEDMKNKIITLSTISDEIPVCILNAQEDVEYVLCKDGIISQTFGNQDEATAKVYYRIESKEAELKFVEKIESYKDLEGNIVYSHHSDEEAEGVLITEEEAKAIEAKYEMETLTIAPILK